MLFCSRLATLLDELIPFGLCCVAISHRHWMALSGCTRRHIVVHSQGTQEASQTVAPITLGANMGTHNTTQHNTTQHKPTALQKATRTHAHTHKKQTTCFRGFSNTSHGPKKRRSKRRNFHPGLMTSGGRETVLSLSLFRWSKLRLHDGS